MFLPKRFNTWRGDSQRSGALRNTPGICDKCHRNASDMRQESVKNVSGIRRECAKKLLRICQEFVCNISFYFLCFPLHKQKLGHCPWTILLFMCLFIECFFWFVNFFFKMLLLLQL